MNSVAVFNALIIIGIVTAGIIIALADDLITCIISASVLGILMALEFFLLGAPEVAFVEAAVSAVLIPTLLLTVLKRVKDKPRQEQDEQKEVK
ncbi:MAG: DUF4040 domain-containing protein [Bacillota bacterium]|nr:DUF4040 domain-containing protein [Bacillota bacterium]